MKKYFLSLLMLLSILSFISATATVTFDVYQATLKEGQQINSNLRVSDFDVVGYTCKNAACTSVSGKVNALSKHSSSSSISLDFPTKLLSEHGYLLYFYKEGHIGHEEIKVKIYGEGSGKYPNRIYLYKKESGIAQIKNLKGVEEEIKNGTTISLTYDVFADGDLEDAILDNRNAKNYPLMESTNVNSWFLIKNSDGEIIKSLKESNKLAYSGSFSKSFNFLFNEVGLYNVTIISEIDDAKILNPKNDSFSFIVNVSSDQEDITEEESYSGYSKIVSFTNETDKLVVNQFSSKKNKTGEYRISSNVSLKIFKGNSLVSEKNIVANRTENVLNFAVSELPSGEYKAKLNVCPVLEKNFTCDNKELTFTISDGNIPDEDENESYSGYSKIVSLEKSYANVFVEQFSKKTNQTGTYNVSSNLTLTISKNGTVLKKDNFILGKDEFDFEYKFPLVSHGKYLVEALVCPVLEGNFTCDNKSILFVIPEDTGENESYFGTSNITSLDYTNSSDSNYTFDLGQITEKTNQTGTYNISAVLTIEIYNETSKIYHCQELLEDSEHNFEFNYNFTTPGTYIVSFTVCPNLPGNFTCSQKNITIVIPKKDSGDDNVKKKTPCCIAKTLNLSEEGKETKRTFVGESDEEEIHLGFAFESNYEREFLYYWLLSTLILSLFVVVLLIVYFFKKGL